IRRGLERSHEDCRARDGEFPGGTEDGVNVAGRSLFTHFDRRRLPRLPGGGYPQGSALHDPQVDFHEVVAISRVIECEEIMVRALASASCPFSGLGEREKPRTGPPALARFVPGKRELYFMTVSGSPPRDIGA